MLPGKFLVIGATTTALIFTLCAKKQDVQSSVPQSSVSNTATQTTAQKSDSEDIFNEFYKDESGNQKEKLTSKETFTPSGSSASTKSSIKESTPLPSKKQVATSDAKFSSNGRYVVQVSTIKSSSVANKLKNKLNAAGYPAYVTEVQNPVPSLSGEYYRVRIGAFSTISEARNFGESVLKANGYDYWIDHKSNDAVGTEGNGLGNSGSSYTKTVEPTPASSNSSWSSSSSSSSNDNWITSAAQPASSSSSSTTNNTTTAATTVSTSSSTASSSPAAAPASTQKASSPATNNTASNQASSTKESTPASTGNASKSNVKDTSGWGASGW